MASQCLDRVLNEQEKTFIAEMFNRLSPIGFEVAEGTFDQLVQAKGNKLHLQYYLDQLELAIKTTRRK